MTRVALAAALLLAALPAAAKDRDPLAGRTAGTPVDCLDLMGLSGPTIIDEHTILYRVTDKRIWRTEAIDGCPAAAPTTTMLVEVWGNRICRGDRFRIIQPGSIIPSRFCRFGAFVPYEK